MRPRSANRERMTVTATRQLYSLSYSAVDTWGGRGRGRSARSKERKRADSRRMSAEGKEERGETYHRVLLGNRSKYDEHEQEETESSK